ncbi:MAG TPA: signal peptidase I [Dehalococcoidales bacterium]|nr:signal peptidase I [Dehalococcoidales bacterium]
MLGVVLAAVAFVVTAVQFGWEFNAVLSGSMEPELGVGGLVVFKPVDGQDVVAGDVISFKIPGIDTPICHRVIDRQETADGPLFQTMGDANEEPDINLVSAEDVNGKAVFYLPYVGYLGRLSQSGMTPLRVLGKNLPAAVLVILVMGMAFIGLTLKDMWIDIFRPSKRLRQEALKRRKERLQRQRKMFGVG